MSSFNSTKKSLWTASTGLLDTATDVLTASSNYIQAMSEHSERVLLDQKNKTAIHKRTSKRDVLRTAMANQAHSDKEWSKFIEKEELSPEYLKGLQQFLEGEVDSLPLYPEP